MQEILLTHPNMIRDMNAGRVLIVHHEGSCNKLGLLLSIDPRSKAYKVLVLTSGDSKTEQDGDALVMKITSLSQLENSYYYPTSKISHAVVALKSKEIWSVTRVQVKIEADKILADWENRQIPRFKYVCIQ